MTKLILAVLLMVVVGCSGGGDQPEFTTDNRFVVTSKQVNIPTGYSASYVLCDTQTDTEYLVVFGIRSVAVTPLGTTCQPYVRLLRQ